MHAWVIAPKLDVTGNRFVGRASRTARVLWLYSFDRWVTLDRQRRVVSIVTTRLWFWRTERRVRFDQVDRIVLRAQSLSGLGLWSLLTLGVGAGIDGALFLISLGLNNGHGELFLFTVWEEQGGDGGLLRAMAGDRDGEPSLGDEGAGEVIARLREFLAVPVSSH